MEKGYKIENLLDFIALTHRGSGIVSGKGYKSGTEDMIYSFSTFEEGNVSK